MPKFKNEMANPVEIQKRRILREIEQAKSDCRFVVKCLCDQLHNLENQFNGHDYVGTEASGRDATSPRLNSRTYTQ